MQVSLSLAAIRGVQFGIGAACGTGLFLGAVGERKIIEVSASAGFVAGIAAIAFTLISETLGSVVAVGVLAGFTVTALTVFAITVTTMTIVAFTVALLAPIIIFQAVIESIRH